MTDIQSGVMAEPFWLPLEFRGASMRVEGISASRTVSGLDSPGKVNA
jgi:hypothetical protein